MNQMIRYCDMIHRSNDLINPVQESFDLVLL